MNREQSAQTLNAKYPYMLPTMRSSASRIHQSTSEPEDTQKSFLKQHTMKRRRIRRVTILLCFIALSASVGWVLCNRYLVEHIHISGIVYPREVAAQSASPTAAVPSSSGLSVKRFSRGKGNNKVTYFVADITVANGKSFLACFAKNEFGENVLEKTSSMAARVCASFAVNGDYYGFRTDGIIIRDGVLYRDAPARTGLAIYADGHMESYNEADTTGKALLRAGVWNTYSFGPALVAGGAACAGLDQPYSVDTTDIHNKQPRTAIGMVEPNHFIIVVVDGRQTGYSCGMTFQELADVFIRFHCQVAYNLDGGKSATMYYDGNVINRPCSNYNERSISDAICLF